MDLALIKLSIERMLEKVEDLETENVELKKRVSELEKSHEQKIVTEANAKRGGFQDELLDTKQVRKFLGISHNTLQAIVSAGKLIQKRINGHSVRYLKSNVMAYIQSLE
jgi:predicted DNA-binding transcriptional regulator AlpA